MLPRPFVSVWRFKLRVSCRFIHFIHPFSQSLIQFCVTGGAGAFPSWPVSQVHQSITAPTLSLVDSLIVFLLWPLLYLYCTWTLSCNTVLVLRWMFLFYTSINFQIQGRIIKDGLKMHFISYPCALSLHSCLSFKYTSYSHAHTTTASPQCVGWLISPGLWT